MNRYAFYSNVERYKDANPEEHEKDAIKHYGIMGQKWGQRRWQNPDGTFNQAGKERYFGSGKNEKNPDGVIGNSSNKKNPSGNMEGSENEKNPNGKIGGYTEHKDVSEKLYPDGAFTLTRDDKYTSDEQDYLMDKKVSKNVNTLADYLMDDKGEKYEKLLNSIDEDHRDTVRRAALDVADSKDWKLNNKKYREISEDVLGLHEVEMGQIIRQKYDDKERQYPVNIRERIVDNIDAINSAINKIESGDFDGYMDDVFKASHGDDMTHDYIEHFIDDVRVMKNIHKEEKEINKELQNMDNIQKNFRHNLEYSTDTHDYFPYSDNDHRSLATKHNDPEINRDGRKVIKNLDKNFDKYVNQFKDEIVNKLYENYKEWHSDDNKILSKSEFKNNIGEINSGSVDNYGYLNLYFEDNNMFYGHVFTSVGTIDDNGNLKIEDIYLEG